MSGHTLGQDYMCKICYFYQRCKDPFYYCERWLHYEYPKKFRRRFQKDDIKNYLIKG